MIATNRTLSQAIQAQFQRIQFTPDLLPDDLYPLNEPFLMLATQNPIEQEGTYPPPEAQVARFRQAHPELG